MSLPAGVFWCWQMRGLTHAGRVYYTRYDVRWGKTDNVVHERCRDDFFLHIHGVVPEPGWALKLKSGLVSHCPHCDSVVARQLCDECGYASGRQDMVYHAEILDRKPLEGKE